MIIIKLIGGLGNQMFQYAAGRSLAHKLGTGFKLDISYFPKEGVTKRQYRLGIFNIQENFASQWEVQVARLFRKNYLEGYWQSEDYFSDISDLIKKEFTFKNKPRRAIAENSVSLHLRRGDYVTNPKVSHQYFVCDNNYYETAARIISKKLKDPKFYIFAEYLEDFIWAKNNLNLGKKVVNIHYKDYEDLQLMSMCKHNIIANSSFSWWGAWLNNNPGKIVIAPKRWFKDSSKNIDNLIPSAWLKI